MYDNEDSVCGIIYNDEPYYFTKNLQGDVITIVDKNAQTVAKYSYDAWGVCDITFDCTAIGIATINPYRYRSYYFDRETGLYYLQSRYYNASVCRFVNIDKIHCVGKSGTVIGTDLYSYCENNSICRIDTSGMLWLLLIVTGVYHINNRIHLNYNKENAPSGFIYNQGAEPVANLKFGFFNSRHNGCGWISTYNALIMLGENPKAEEIISEYEMTGAVLWGALGVQPYAITHYFRFRGHKVTVTYDSEKFDEIAKNNTANIIFYWHNSGAHYVALHWKDKGFVGYNTYSNSNGPDNWGESILTKLNSKKWRATLLISISKK